MTSDIHYAVLTIKEEPCRIVGYYPWHSDRKRIEHFIAERFNSVYGAHLHHFMPLLVALETEAGELLAVVGVRAAQTEKLFLEQYLNEPIERVIATHLQVDGRCLDALRPNVVEVGNLAALKPGYGRYLFAVLTDLLSAWHFRWLACTGITGVVNALRRLGIEPRCVAPATPERIPGGVTEWGDYYNKHPQVMVGEIEQGRIQVERCGLLQSCQYRRLEQTDVLSA